MSEYRKKFKKKTNRTLYYRDGFQVAKNDIPADILEALKISDVAINDEEPMTSAPINPQPVENDLPAKECIFDGEPTKYSRMLNGKQVYLCNDDYYNKSLGQIAQKVREVLYVE